MPTPAPSAIVANWEAAVQAVLRNTGWDSVGGRTSVLAPFAITARQVPPGYSRRSGQTSLGCSSSGQLFRPSGSTEE